MTTSTSHSLRKSRNILKWAYAQYKSRWQTLDSEQLQRLESFLSQLDSAIQEKDRQQASVLADQVKALVQELFPGFFRSLWLRFFSKKEAPVLPRSNPSSLKKRGFSSAKELVFALVFALLAATVIRQCWFELYAIPTGSMRPTYKEQDHLIVNKTTLGLNVPISAQHFFFCPENTQRTGIFIFTAEGLDVPDPNTLYFGIFPSKKRYIKRLMGKPGDTLYFYGGQIYGFDEEGNDLRELWESPFLDNLEYIPFSNFSGRFFSGDQVGEDPSSVYFHHMHQPVGKVRYTSQGLVDGEIFDGTRWRPETSSSSNEKGIQHFSDLWGMGNFAMVRMVSREELRRLVPDQARSLESAEYYLELKHHPSLSTPSPTLMQNAYGGLVPILSTHSSYLPLREEHLEALRQSLYTSRFVVRKGRAVRYSVNLPSKSPNSPKLLGIPDGTYEFYYGKAYSVSWGGTPTELDEAHPLSRLASERLQTFFNLGIEWNTAYRPLEVIQALTPSRFAYFRNGALFVMGAPIYQKEDADLQAFVERESQKADRSAGRIAYRPFIDQGPPLLEDGSVDQEFVKTYGITIPPKGYFALGDNHSMSGDSRYFGFVPENNIRGTPTVLLWPFDNRWGWPKQPDYAIATKPAMVVWSIVGLLILAWGVYSWKRRNDPIFKKLSP